MSLAVDVHSVSRTSLSTCPKIKYSNRSDTSGSRRSADHRWSATQARLLAPHRVDPIDISNAVLFLASDESRYVTGLTMTVDAGATAPYKARPGVANQVIPNSRILR
jgi:NAD(P)-dependent dehydrogenase (short-subunit alcohol dehydrogenase family)